MKDLISIKDLAVEQIEEYFGLADEVRLNKEKFSSSLKAKSVGLIFQKPSNRTRVSFEVAVYQLGGHCIYLGPQEIRLGSREATKDVALTLSRYLDGVVARTFAHEDLVELAIHATVPVINGLSDLLHPCQVLADLYTIRQKRGKFKGLSLAYVGDGNNVCHSLVYGAAKLGIDFKISTPKRYRPNKDILDEGRELARQSGSQILWTDVPGDVAQGADIIYTDVWVSMGQEEEYKEKLVAFKGFQVNSKLISLAKPDCLVMHCLPAHRGEEISDEVIDGPNSIVFDQAENRLYVQKAILIKLLGR
jgi:ornithine carbamoyltransferase